MSFPPLRPGTPRGGVFRLPALSSVVALAGAIGAFAAEPSLKHLYPVAGARGATVAVTPSGKFDPWPPSVWIDAPGITFKPAAKGKFDVEVAPDAPLGPHLVRFHNADGASALRYFIVTEKPDLAEKEPNDSFKSPQQTELPCVVSGRLDKSGDVDSYALELKAGTTLTAQLEAYVLGSTFDGMLRVVDEHGSQWAFNHDGRTLDPKLVWKAPHNGRFVIQVMGFVYPATADVRLTGGDGCVYRLHLSTDSAAFAAQPTAKKEAEPNDARENAQFLEVPETISGTIAQATDQDRFAFMATKGKSYEIVSTVSGLETLADTWLKVENSDGKELVRNDDVTGMRDSRVIWRAPADGKYNVVIGEVTHRGGPEYRYELKIAEATPSVAGTVAVDSYVVKADKPAEIKVAVKRTNGFKTKLKLVAADLPPGITAADVDVPEKDGEVTLKLVAASDALSSAQPFKVLLREAEGNQDHQVKFAMTQTAENNGVPQGYRELVIPDTSLLWVTVVGRPEPKAAPPVNVVESPAKTTEPTAKVAAAATKVVPPAKKSGEPPAKVTASTAKPSEPPAKVQTPTPAPKQKEPAAIATATPKPPAKPADPAAASPKPPQLPAKAIEPAEKP